MRSPEELKSLKDAVRGQTTPVHVPATVAGAKEYYQGHASRYGWKADLAMAVSGASSKKEASYKAAKRAIEREATGQHKGFAPKYAAGITQVAQKLPVDHYNPKAGGITVTIQGTMKDGDGTRDRIFSQTFRSGDAYTLAQNPTFENFWEAYGINPKLMDSGTYALSITSISSTYVP